MKCVYVEDILKDADSICILNIATDDIFRNCMGLVEPTTEPAYLWLILKICY